MTINSPLLARCKAVFFLALLLGSGQACIAADAKKPERQTAYSALRAVAKHEGSQFLAGVVEVRGSGGLNQPKVWRVTVSEPTSGPGVREFEVQDGTIVADRAAATPCVTAMNVKALNLDSTGAFEVARHAVQKAGGRFDRINYQLKFETAVETPLWVLELFSGDTRSAFVAIDANNGKVLRQSNTKTADSTKGNEPQSEAAPQVRPSDFFRQMSARFRASRHATESFATNAVPFDPKQE